LNKSIFIHNELGEPLTEKLKKYKLSFNNYVNQLIKIDLKKELVINNKRTKRVDYFEKLFLLKDQIQKQLFRIYWKNYERNDFAVECGIEYLKEKKKYIQQYSQENLLIKWIDEQIDLLKSNNFDNLDINIRKRELNLVNHPPLNPKRF